MRGFSIVSCLVLVLAAVASFAQTKAASPATPATRPTGNAEHGKELFSKYGCYQCHGYEAQGSIAGDKLGPNPWPLAAFTAYIRMPANQMPPYTSKVLSDAEIAEIYAFVGSRTKPAVRPALLSY